MNEHLDDPLVGEVARVYKSNRDLFNKTAKEWTAKHAMSKTNKTKMANIISRNEEEAAKAK